MAKMMFSCEYWGMEELNLTWEADASSVKCVSPFFVASEANPRPGIAPLVSGAIIYAILGALKQT